MAPTMQDLALKRQEWASHSAQLALIKEQRQAVLELALQCKYNSPSYRAYSRVLDMLTKQATQIMDAYSSSLKGVA